MGSPELFRYFQLAVQNVHGDNGKSPGKSRSLYGVESDAPRPDDHDAAHGFYFSTVDDSAEAGRHAARQQRRAVERHVRGNFRDQSRRAGGILGKAADGAPGPPKKVPL